MAKSITLARLATAGACALLLLAAVGGAAAKVEGDTVVLGAAVSLTGKYSVNGKNTKDGYDLELTRAVVDAVQIPVIASGGAGHPKDLAAVLTLGRADAALAASIFHSGAFPIRQTKAYLAGQGIPVRI